jgi:type 1 glutamine amidotransferase
MSKRFAAVIVGVCMTWAGHAGSTWVARAQAPTPAPPPAAAAPRPNPQGGTGAIKVALITKGHAYDREGLNLLFDSLGEDISWSHVEHPAASLLWDPKSAGLFDVFVFFDAPGRQQRKSASGAITYDDPGPDAKKNLPVLMQAGTKGWVFLHHAIASWNHTWPEYSEMVGGACDWGNPVTFRGKEFPNSGAQGGVKQRMTVVDKAHSITQGLGDGFDIVDETYLCPYADEAVQPLLRTDFKPMDVNFPGRYAKGWRHAEGSNLAGWVKVAGRSPIAYLQNGHDRQAWENPAYRTMLLNAIRWAASKESKTWAAANAKTGTPVAWRPAGTN